MPKPTKPRSKSTTKRGATSKSVASRNSSILSRKIDFKLAVFIILFAAVGAYFLIRSQADASKAYVLAESATNLTTQANGPRVITEDTGNKRNSKVVYVSAPTNQTNAVKLTHTADKAGIYSICGTGRAVGTATNTAKLVVNTTVNTTNPASKAQAYKPGNDYVGNCFEFTIDKAGTLNIENQVTAGSWRFAMVIVKLIRETETPQPPKSKTSYPTTKEQTGLGRLGISASSLPVYNGPTEITTNGTVIQNVRITKPLVITANDVTLRKVDINASGSYAIVEAKGSDLLIEDSDIHGYGTERLMRLGSSQRSTLKRVAVWGGESGIDVGNSTVIEDTFVNLNYLPGNGQHTAALASSGGTSGVRVTRSKLVNEGDHQSSSISIYPQNWAGGPNVDWVIENSYIYASSAYYTLYAGHTAADGEKPNRQLVFRNNIFAENDKNFSAYIASWSGARTNGPNGNEYGNVWDNNKDTSGNVISL